MYYRQLKDFFRQREQKAFWIFNYANIVGLFVGLFVARFLSEQFRWLPGVILFPAVMLAGLACTWPRQGRETYKTWWLLSRYLVRRIFASTSLAVSSNDYYPAEQARRGVRPFAVAGRLVYLGDRSFLNASIPTDANTNFNASAKTHPNGATPLVSASAMASPLKSPPTDTEDIMDTEETEGA